MKMMNFGFLDKFRYSRKSELFSFICFGFERNKLGTELFDEESNFLIRFGVFGELLHYNYLITSRNTERTKWFCVSKRFFENEDVEKEERILEKL